MGQAPAAPAGTNPPAGPAGAERLASWSGQAVTIGDVNAALSGLRRSEERTATRTSVVNLVVAASDHDGAERAQSAMRRLGHRHPGRTLALVCQPDRPDGIDARVELHQATAEGRAIWWEEVRLQLGGRLCHHVDSLVTPLLLDDLPVAVWYPSALPPRGDPLAAMAHAVLVDARWAGEDEDAAPDAWPALAELGRRRPVVDLSWKRLTPWRQLLAGLFDVAPFRPFGAGVTGAEVAAHAGPGRLLAGWLMDRLGLPASEVTLRRAVHAGIRLTAAADGRRAAFTVARPTDAPLVAAHAEVEGGPSHREAATLPEHGLTWSLAEALSSLHGDRVYEHAVHAGLALSRGLQEE
ncbi:MAG: glucose-6-phosphate dehydrogenase assembly protein OpcA [Acidimicrobiales bacterium]